MNTGASEAKLKRITIGASSNKSIKLTTTVTRHQNNSIMRGEVSTGNTYIHDHSLYWLGTGTLIKLALMY